MAKSEKGEARGLRDEANVGPDPRQARHLVPLHELKSVKVADGDPDIRGWTVFSSTGREVGRVQELLVDADLGEVVMLDIDLRRDDRHTLAPIRAAWIDRATRRVVIDSKELDADDLIPSLPRQGSTSDDEVRQFDERYRRAYGDRGHDAEREYRVRRASDELYFRRPHGADAPGATATAAGAAGATAARTDAPAVARVEPADRRGFDRERGDRDAAANELPMSLGVEPDVLDAQTRAGVAAHPHGDRYGSAENVVGRHTFREGDTVPAARVMPGDLPESARSVRYPRHVEDASDERRRVVLEEVVVRRRAVDPSELTEEERAQLRANPDATLRRER